ncbi:hypothetical protein HNY73_004237 [Argiope bruennichi]|uniref:Uncharacterized protein n=1 Tax=Argiope bruennichi TaxID=94029 RepID=A0A8T0FP83_ARGBR|nr:hypothetical protein HNY73_004237 [Argiope bruennichi]
MITNIDDFKVNPSSGRIKGKDILLLSVDRLSRERELGLAVLIKEYDVETPEKVDCWHCIFRKRPGETHMFLLRIEFYRNRFEAREASCRISSLLVNDISGESDQNEENDSALCLTSSYNGAIEGAVGDVIPVDQIQQEFISAAEKYIKDMDMLTRKERSLLMAIKEALPQEAKRAMRIVKDSMQQMHAKYAKHLDGKLNEMTAVLTRVEHLHEEILDFKQWEDEEGESRIEAFLQEALQKKLKIESTIEDMISELNRKRQNDERLFSEFSESINQQVRWSLQVIERCLQKSDMRRKNLLDAKLSELKAALRELKKFV